MGTSESLGGYLIKPVQRICRYALLLRELLKYGNEEYEDTPLLNEAADLIANILNDSNEKVSFIFICLSFIFSTHLLPPPETSPRPHRRSRRAHVLNRDQILPFFPIH